MHSFTRKIRALVVLAGVVAAFAAITAAPVSAAVVNAKFSGSSIKVTTPGITIKNNGANAKTCTLQGGSASASIGNGMAFFMQALPFTCTGGTYFELNLLSIPKYDNVAARYFLEVNEPFSMLASPYGWYQNSRFEATWVNGAGATKSTINFVDLPIAGKWLTVTGTFTATTNSGGLLTLSH